MSFAPRRARGLLRCAALAGSCLTGLAVVASPALADPTYSLSAFAGTGATGTPTPGTATLSMLNTPSGEAVDAAGNVYIADAGNNVVEKVTPAGALSIVAGTGTAGAPTPGPATSSDLNDPRGVAVDAAGDVYIADTDNHVVEQVTPAGTLSIIAGMGTYGTPTAGPATSSAMEAPWGVAVDTSGDVFVSDDDVSDIYKISPSGTLSIFAGTGGWGWPTPGPAVDSTLYNPAQIAIDASGNLYIADYDNSAVEKVTASGTLSILAGNGSWTTPTPGPATSSSLSGPFGVAVDAAGDVYIADTFNNLVEEVTPDGTLSVIAGDGTAGAPTYNGPATGSDLNQPYGLASTAAGKIYISDSFNGTIDTLAPPVVSGVTAPVVTGGTVAGDTLSATPGTWANDPVLLTYQWYDCPVTVPTIVEPRNIGCHLISGATSSTYTLQASDVGYRMRVVVTAANGGGQSVQGSAFGAVVTAPPVAATPSPSPSTSTSSGGTTSTPTPVTPTPAPVTAPAPAASCPAPTGSLSGRQLGPFTLGETRSAARAALPGWRLYPYGFDDFCLTGGAGIRVDYPSQRVLATVSRAGRSRIDGRIVLALTSDRYYALDGVRPGARLSSVVARLHAGAGLQVGLNWWYVVPGRAANGVLKVRDGVIDEIGIASKSVTGTRAAEQKLF